MTANDTNLVQQEFAAGKAAFERGDYRKSVEYLERACALGNPNSALGGSTQIWLVTAYQAVGQLPDAIALCRALTRHPDITTRKEGKRLLYILEAPKLQTRADWVTQIPELDGLGENATRDRVSAASRPAAKPQPPARPAFQVEPPVDRSQVNTEDNRFIGVALVAVLLVLGGLLWFM